MYEVKVFISVACLSVHHNYICLEKCWTLVRMFNHPFRLSCVTLLTFFADVIQELVSCVVGYVRR
jgi:hypothetical protein